MSLLDRLSAAVTSLGSHVFWFLLVVGVLVFLHEAGHFLTAKAFGMRVDVFSLGFGRRLFGRKKGDTDYRVSLIPLGGYVKLTGGEEAGEAAGAIPPDYFLARPRWQRFLVLFNGAFVNLVLAVVLFSVTFMLGAEVPAPVPARVADVLPGSPAERAGVAPGDRVVAIDGAEVDEVDDVRDALVRGGSRELHLRLERGAQRPEVVIRPSFQASGIPELGIVFEHPAVAWSVSPGMPAERAGIRVRDRIVAIDGQPIADAEAAARTIHGSLGRELAVTVERGGERLDVRVSPVPQVVDGKEIGLIGIGMTPVEVVRLPPGPAFARGLDMAWKQAGALFQVLKNLVTLNQPFSTLSGPIEIAKVSKDFSERGVQFLFWMAFISLQLGILNLLPIPVLDGGHVFILLTEGVLRRDLSIELKERLNQVGFFFLVGLMAAVLLQDIWKNFLRTM